MSWSDFYLMCFAFGFVLTLVSLLGSLDLHIPHFHFHIGASGSQAPHAGGAHGGDISPINFGTIAAFFAWFGGAGYLISRFSTFWAFIGLGIAGASGFTGAAIMFYFLAKVLIQKDEELNPADYEMIGVLGRVSSDIRSTGTGEIIFSQAGSRRASPARSENEGPIARGTEVIVTRYERGVAYVRPWDELTNSTVTSNQN